jgi:hypothetical protein
LQEEKFEDNKKQLEVANQRMTDNTMVKTIMGGGDKQWWTIQTTQWSRE